MIEIQTSLNIDEPVVAVCKAGNICLYLPSHWDINEALTYCEQDLLSLLHTRFKALFADKNFPRNFEMAADRLAIKPNMEQLPSRQIYFENFLDV